MENKNDINNLINKFDKNASMPDAKFRYALKEQILNEYDKKGFIEGIYDKFAGINLKTLSLASSVMVLTVIAYMSFNAFGNKNYITFNPTSSSENQQIIRNILSSNSSSQINLETSIIGKVFQISDIESSSDFGKQNEISPDSYYYKSITQNYVLGPQSSTCIAVSDNTFPAVSYSNVAYKLDNSKYYINNLSYNTQNELINNYYTDNISQTLYLGGQYVAKFDISTQLDKKTLSDDLDYKEIKLVNDGSYPYYQLTRDSETAFCTGSINNSSELNPKVLNVLEINADNYKVVNSRYYLNSIEDKNLILTIQSTYSEKYDVWNNIQDKFLETDKPVIDESGRKLSTTLIIPETAITNSVNIAYSLSNKSSFLSILFDENFYPISKSNLNLMEKTIRDYTLSYYIELDSQYKTTNSNTELILISSQPSILNSFIDNTDSHSNNVSIYIDGNKVISTFHEVDGTEDQYEIVAIYNLITYTINYKGDIALIPRFKTIEHLLD